MSACIEVPFTDGEKHLRPDGLIQVAFGQRIWTALVEVKTGQHDLIPGQLEAYLDVGADGRGCREIESIEYPDRVGRFDEVFDLLRGRRGPSAGALPVSARAGAG